MWAWPFVTDSRQRYMTASFGSMCFLPQLNDSALLCLFLGYGISKRTAELKAICKTVRARQNMSKHKSWPGFKLFRTCHHLSKVLSPSERLAAFDRGHVRISVHCCYIDIVNRSKPCNLFHCFSFCCSLTWSQIMHVLGLEWVKTVAACPHGKSSQ